MKNEKDPDTGEPVMVHTFFNVHREMLIQVCRDYPGLPDPRTLTASEIRFFYEGLRPELERTSAPKDTTPKR